MPIGKSSIARAEIAAKAVEEKKVETPLTPEPASEKKTAVRRGRKPGSKNKPKVATSVIANISPEVVEKVAKPKKAKIKPAEVKSAFSIGDDLPEYLL